MPQRPSIRNLLPQDPSHTRPAPPGLPNIGNDRRPIVVGCHQEASHVIKLRHCFQWPVISLERRHCPQLRLLFHQPPSLPFLSPFTGVRCKIAAVQRCPGYEYFTGLASGVGAVTFLHDLSCVLHVALHEVDTEVGTHRLPPLLASHWKSDETGCPREGDPIYPGLRCG